MIGQVPFKKFFYTKHDFNCSILKYSYIENDIINKSDELIRLLMKESLMYLCIVNLNNK